MTSYSVVKIGEVGKVVTGKTPKTSVAENYGNDYMFLGPVDLHKHFFISKSEKMISEKGLSSIKGSTLNGISILVGCIGWDMGNVALVKEKCVTNQQINSITNIKNGYNPFYIYYWLKTKKKFLFQQANVTRTPILNKTDFSNIEINMPEEAYQDKVIEVLTAIDTKIEVNNKIIAELEAMAKLMYEYWFVQFDYPDVNGKPYKSSGGKMTYSKELKREIPAGWSCGVVDDIADLVRGVSYTKEDIAKASDEAVTPILRATNITGNKIDLEDMVYVPDEFVSESQLLNKYDILITMSSGSKEHIGKNGFFYFNKKVAFGAFCAKLTAKKEYQYYLYSYAQSDFMSVTIKNECLGTNINNLNGALVKNFKLPLPDGKVLSSYNQCIEAAYKKVELTYEENRKLKEFRDWLLPMLMNGQVKVNVN